MAEEKKDKWLGYVAMTSIVFAVCATLSTFKGGQFSTRTVLGQSKAANLWAYYQAKDLKSYMHELQKDNLALEMAQGKSQGLDELYRKKMEGYDEKIKKYDMQKQEIEAQARAEEKSIVEAQAHSGNFGMAVIFLQIAILLSSISALMKKIGPWYASMGVGLVGVVYFVNGFTLFF